MTITQYFKPFSFLRFTLYFYAQYIDRLQLSSKGETGDKRKDLHNKELYE